MANSTLTTLHISGDRLGNPDSPALAQRYQILNPLGQGGFGCTYVAQDLQMNRTVVLKVLALKRARDWKKLELFEREAKVLSQLNHSSIPQYLDYFQLDREQDRYFYLVQQLAPGQTLEQLIAGGWRPSLDDIKDIAAQLLTTLAYLQQLLPPVIHRDIKPQNLIRQEQGKLFLVDFGAVQETYRQTITQGSTVVGTFGYVAPEQFRGQAPPASDLYGVGATLLFLLTGQSPTELPQHQLKLNFRSALSQLEPAFADWLERLLEPRAEQRFCNAQEALDVLQGNQALPPQRSTLLPKPLGSPIRLERTDSSLIINIPKLGFRTPQIQRLALVNLLCNGFLLFVVAMMLSLQLFLAPAKLLSFWGLVFIGLFFLVQYAYAALSVTQLSLDLTSNQLSFSQRLLGSTYKKMKVPLTSPFAQPAQLKSRRLWPWPKTPLTSCHLRLGHKQIRLGYYLTPEENAWLVSQINTFAEAKRRRDL